MRWKFAFGLASDDLFFVTTRRDSFGDPRVPVKSKVTTFLNEDEFLGHLIRAGLRHDQTTVLALAVLLSVAKPTNPPAWTLVDLTQRQMEMLHLSGSSVGAITGDVATEPFNGNELYLNAARSGSLPQFYDLLMQAPVALCMVMGPEHRYSFLNAHYASTLGIKSVAKTIGKSILDNFMGVQRQRVAQRLDRLYRTGEPYVGVETQWEFFHEANGRLEERFFNTAFQPITNAFGEVAGILIKTTDVTEAVLAKAVREHREQQLYRQWAELEAIYSTAAIALFVVDAKEHRILKLNQNQAKVFGGSVEELTGKPLMVYLRDPPRMAAILARVSAGLTIRNETFERESVATPGILRCWVSNFSPVFSAGGKVEAVTVIGVEISQEVRARFEASADLELTAV